MLQLPVSQEEQRVDWLAVAGEQEDILLQELLQLAAKELHEQLDMWKAAVI